ncbi:MAG: M28 family peptidase [Flavobacteriales bacterium]|nr:M28 family peptidase [Flavobacteriales bacterium]
MLGRGYVGGGLDLAAEHISKEFKNIGLKCFEEDYYQPFYHRVNTFPSIVELKVDGHSLVPGLEFIVDPSCPQYSGRLKAEIFQIDDAGPLPHPDSLDRSCEDCIVVLDVRAISDKTILSDARQLKYLYSYHAPVIWLSNDKLTWAVSDKQTVYPIIETGSYEVKEGSMVDLKIQAEMIDDFKSKNILGYVQGLNSPDSFIVFTAHYDHLGMMGKEACFYGANDNASGTAFMMSLADHYVERPDDYTCVFIAFAGEEAGLKGSKYFVDNPLIDLSKVRFVINLDLMGSGIEGITVVNAVENKTEFSIMEELNSEYDLLPLIKSRGQAANSDHYFFAEAGVPAVFIYALGGSQAYHDVHDVSSNLTFDEYSDIFRLLTYLVDKL